MSDCSPTGFSRRYRLVSDAHIRASNTERDEITEQLSGHFSEGRLDDAEFKERLDKATSAKTRGDLHGLLGDLPRMGNGKVERRRSRPWIALVLAIIVASVAISWVVTPPHFPWLLFGAIAFFVIARQGRHHHRNTPPYGRW